MASSRVGGNVGSPWGGSFACPVIHSTLATRTSATVEVGLARCHYCSSTMYVSFGAKEPRSLQQTQLCKITTLGLLPAGRVQNGLNIKCAVPKSEAAKL